MGETGERPADEFDETPYDWLDRLNKYFKFDDPDECLASRVMAGGDN